MSQATSTARGCSLSVEPQQQVGEAEDGAGGPLAGAQDVLRQRMIGAVRERIAVDDQQRPALGRGFLGLGGRCAVRVAAWLASALLLGALRSFRAALSPASRSTTQTGA